MTTLVVDGGFDGELFMQWVMDFCRWIVQVVLQPEQTLGFVLLKKRWVVERTYEKANGMSSIGQQTLSYYRKHRKRLSTLP